MFEDFSNTPSYFSHNFVTSELKCWKEKKIKKCKFYSRYFSKIIKMMTLETSDSLQIVFQ